MNVKTGIRSGEAWRTCATCGTSVNMSDMPWFHGPVFCSARCHVKKQSDAREANVSDTDGEST